MWKIPKKLNFDLANPKILQMFELEKFIENEF